MAKISLAVLLAACALSVFPPAIVRAGEPVLTDYPVVISKDPTFQRGAWELQLLEGAEFSLQTTSIIRPNIDYQLTVVRVGYMLDNPRGRNFLRGNDEFLVEVIGGPIFQGPGSALGGVSIMYRRNFLSPGAKVVPFLDLGGGGAYSDASHDRVQQAIGTPFEFNLQAGLGVHLRLTPRWSVDAEFSYRHLSNAHISYRNLGTNGVGGLLGVSRTF